MHDSHPDIRLDPYQDIRPYSDEEVCEVLERLGRSVPLHQALVEYQFPRSPRLFRTLLTKLVGFQLRRHFGPVTTIAAFQEWLTQWVYELVETTTTDVEISGLDELWGGGPYLWISNHRDIAMDPTLVNYALMKHAWATAHIAIGDNLLQNAVVADLMRLNKSFIVKRSAESNREKLKELQRLSAYVRDSMAAGHSIWIAQREGRAKDNRDQTDTAVLKMLALSGRDEKLPFVDAMRRLNPVPVVVQYEWDPCDVMKARELVALDDHGSYEKKPGEDTSSMLTGLRGHKGRVRISFGQPMMADDMQDAMTMAVRADEQMLAMRQVFPANYAALRLLQQEFGLYREVMTKYPDGLELPLKMMRQRCEGEADAVKVKLLTNYAAPLIAESEVAV
jgi:hypothetical protein